MIRSPAYDASWSWKAALFGGGAGASRLAALNQTASDAALTAGARNGLRRDRAQRAPQVAAGLGDRARALATTARKLGSGGAGSAWEARSATSSNAAAVTATASSGATLTSYTINVTRLAAAQQNSGASLSSTAATTLAAGTHTFSLTAGGATRNMSFAVTAGENNNTVLTNMAGAINSAKAGVVAAVKTGTAGALYLQVTAEKTGVAQAFSLADVTGSAVAGTGIGAVSTAAQDASYDINGAAHTSGSNTVSLDAGRVKATLAAVTATAAKVTVGHDGGAVAAAVSDLAGRYNDLLSYVQNNGDLLSPTVAQRFQQGLAAARHELGAIGVATNADGSLTADAVKVAGAVEADYNRVHGLFAGYPGVALGLEGQATLVSARPASYMAADPGADPLAGLAAGVGTAPAARYIQAQSGTLLAARLFGTGSLLDLFF